jgi:hypothetical protein
MWRVTLAISLSVVITGAGISQQAVSVEAKLPDIQMQNDGATTAQAATQTQFKQTVAYWTAEGSWHTELHLRNNMGTAPLLVVPVLHSASGKEFTLPGITVPPKTGQMVDLQAAIRQSAPELDGCLRVARFALRGSLLQGAVRRSHGPFSGQTH